MGRISRAESQNTNSTITTLLYQVRIITLNKVIPQSPNSPDQNI